MSLQRIVIGSVLAGLVGGAGARAGELRQTAVFVSGQDGYHTYRIPSLLVSKKGTLLAFCEGRKQGSGDAGDIDLLLKRSFDGGKTWAKTQLIWDDGPNTCGNPCPVLDAATGTIWLLLTHNLGSDTEAMILAGTSKGARTVWVSNSDDDGATWAKPVEITRAVKRPNWTWYATGPGVGIQLKSGRLLVPCDHYVAGSKEQYAHVIFSDDHGKTWQLGGAVGPKCNESQAVELPDGWVLLNIRSYRGDHRRLVALSKDGGATFAEPVEDRALIEPVCQASILCYPAAAGGILFANPASTKREKMTVRLSRDDGTTWPHARVLHDGPAAYSCLAVLPDGMICCLYERGDQKPYETITCARFPLSLLTGAQTKPLILDLWPGKAPGDVGIAGEERFFELKVDGKPYQVAGKPTKWLTNVTRPTLTVYRPARERDTGVAMLICPGGGYHNLGWDVEGEEVAAWLNSIGVTGIILKYRCPRRPGDVKGEPPAGPLVDAQRAVRLVRSRAKEWGIDPNKIGMVGFSAGGHLAGATATNFDRRTYDPIDAIDQLSCRPDFAVMLYSGYLKAKDKDALAADLPVSAQTPPILLIHATDDKISIVDHSVMMYLALKRAGASAEMHLYASGGHGFGVRKTDAPCCGWTERCTDWLRSQGLLPRGPVIHGKE